MNCCVLFVLIGVAAAATCTGSKSAQLPNVNFNSPSATYIDVNVPPGTSVRVLALEDDDDNTIAVDVTGHDDISVTLKDGNAPGQVSLIVTSAKSDAQPLPSLTTTVADGFGTASLQSTAARTGDSKDSSAPTNAGLSVRGSSAVVSLITAAVSCLAGLVMADDVCPLTVTIKIAAPSAPYVRFTNLNDKSSLVCALGLPAIKPLTMTGVTLKTDPLTWAPSSDGYCLQTSFYKKTSTFGECKLNAGDDIAVVTARSNRPKVYVNGKLSSEMRSSQCRGSSCGYTFDVDGVDGTVTAFTVDLSTARFAVQLNKDNTTYCDLVYSCTGGMCVKGYDVGSTDNFCALEDSMPATAPAPVSVCANPPVSGTGNDTEAALRYCRSQCGGSSSSNSCDAAIDGECCGSTNAKCYSFSNPSPVTCSTAWGTNCRSVGCTTLCSIADGCPATGGSCPSTSFACKRRCTCFPPHCNGAFSPGFASNANKEFAGVSTAIVTILFLTMM